MSSSEPPDGADPALGGHGGFRKQLTGTLVSQAAAMACGATSAVVVARQLGPAGQGRAAVVLTAGVLGLTLTATPLQTVAVRYIARDADRQIASTILALAGGLGLIGAALVLLAGHEPLGVDLLGDVSATSVLLGAAFVSLGAVDLVASGLLRGTGRVSLSAMIDFAESLLVLTLISAIVIAGTLSPAAVIGCYVAAVAFSLAVTMSFLQRDGAVRWGAPSRPLGVEMMRFGRPVWVSNLAQFATQRVDILLVNAISGVEAAGRYSVAIRIGESVFLAAYAFNAVASTRSAKLEGDVLAKTTPSIFWATVVGGLLASAAVALLGRVIIDTVIGPEFRTAYGPMLLLLPGLVAFGALGILANELIHRGYAQAVLRASVRTFVVALVLWIAMIPPLGPAGAALGSSIAFIIGTALVVGAYERAIGISAREFLLAAARLSELRLRRGRERA